MYRYLRAKPGWRFFLIALPCALGLVFFVPALASAHSIATQHIARANLAGTANDTIDGPTLFNLVMIALLDVCAVFWVGAQCWLSFVPQTLQARAGKNGDKAASVNAEALYQAAQRRFELGWAVPTLIVLLLANVGIIVGQILSVTGQWSSAFSLSLLWQLASTGRFGLFWSLREICTLIALLLALYTLFSRTRLQNASSIVPLINLLLGAIIFITMSVTSHASVVTESFQTYAILVDWFHLVASALWVGCIFFLVTCYLPVTQGKSVAERVYALITMLPSYARLAIAGMVILTVTGIFSSQVHLTSTAQLIDTAYGRTLIVKSLLVVALLVTSISTLFFLRPRLTKEYRKYLFAQEGVVFHPEQQVKLREERLTQRTQRVTTIMRWEAGLGIAILLCAALLDVFGGTLSATPTTNQPSPPVNKSSVYTATAQTSDGVYIVKLTVNPNRFGTNEFTVTITDKSTGKATTGVGVSLFTTMLDMDMGTDNTALQPDGKGGYSGSGVLSMGGHWEIRVAIHTTDGRLHEAIFKIYTPF